jgi:hypothetical protein
MRFSGKMSIVLKSNSDRNSGTPEAHTCSPSAMKD